MDENTEPRTAGRPPLFESGKMRKYKIALDRETVRKARALSAANEISDGIRRAVAAAYDLTGPAPDQTQE